MHPGGWKIIQLPGCGSGLSDGLFSISGQLQQDACLKPIRHHASRLAYFMPGNKPFIPLAMLISLRIFCPLNIFIIFCDCSNWFSILLTS